MSFREITMQEVSEVLRRWQAGQSARRIAREMGLDRKTVGRYIDEAKAGGVMAEIAVTEELARAVGKGVQTRPLPPPSEQWRALTRRRDQISGWLVGDHAHQAEVDLSLLPWCRVIQPHRRLRFVPAELALHVPPKRGVAGRHRLPLKQLVDSAQTQRALAGQPDLDLLAALVHRQPLL